MKLRRFFLFIFFFLTQTYVEIHANLRLQTNDTKARHSFLVVFIIHKYVAHGFW